MIKHMKLVIKINHVSINLHVCMFTLLLACIDSSLPSKNCNNWLRDVYFCKFWSHKKLDYHFLHAAVLEMCGRDIFRIYWIAFMSYLSEGRRFLSPARWVTFLLGCICRARSQLSTSQPLLLLAQGPARGLGQGLMEPWSHACATFIWLLGARMALQFGRCWRRASHWGEGQCLATSPAVPRGSEAKGTSFRWLPSLICLGRRH